MGDTYADEVVKALFEQGFNPLRDDAYTQYQFNHQAIPTAFPTVLQKYFETLKATKLDRAVIEKGSEFFMANAQPIMLCLGLLSLPYCYGAADGAKVLVFSKRIMEQPEKRLMETAEFVLDVTASDAFEPKGKGFVSIGKVRLMHAAIRYHLLNSDKWNMDWGYPVNQKDMAGTNYSFSLIVIRGLRKLGYNISTEVAEIYIKYWNEIGKILGLEAEMRPETNKEAFILEQKIRGAEFRSSSEGKALTASLMHYIDAQETPLPVKGSDLAGYLLGSELAEMLAINTSTEASLEKPVKLIGKLQSRFGNKNFNDFLLQFRRRQGTDKHDSRFNFLLSLTA